MTALNSTNLMVSWPALDGFSVANYEVYADGAAVGSPTAVVTNIWWTMKGLTPNSTHTFKLDYVLTSGLRSPLSTSTSGTTWSSNSWFGIPYEWMAAYYGGYINGKYYTNNWPNPGAPLAPGGWTLLKVFEGGGNPLDSTTWLQEQLQSTPEGMFLSWNPQPGLIYQVQVSTNMGSWANLGAARFAAGTVDSIYVGGSGKGYYRVLLVR